MEDTLPQASRAESLFNSEVNYVATEPQQARLTRCCCFDIKQGTNAIGAIFQPFLILLIVAVEITWGHYWQILIIIFPILNLCFFFRMTRSH